MRTEVKLGFHPTLEVIPFTAILPSRPMEAVPIRSTKYASIRTSIEAVGIIEPLLVYPIPGKGPKQYLLIDGHLRLSILQAQGLTEVLCLITLDDETYTVSACVNALVPIQEHYMILHAIDQGVSEDRIAQVLNVDVQRIRAQRNLLEGICDETINLLKDKEISEAALKLLRKAKPTRQVRIAERMNALCNYSVNFVRAMIATTPEGQRNLSKAEQRKVDTIDPADLAAFERDLETLQRRILQHQEHYGQDFARLTLIRGYLNTLLENARVIRFLAMQFPDHLRSIQKIVEFSSLEVAAAPTTTKVSGT